MDPNLWIVRMTMRVPSYYECPNKREANGSAALGIYTHSGAFLDMVSGSPIDDLVESGTIRLLDWNDSMTDIQLVCRENESRVDTYVPEIYSRQTYRKTYQANFHPVLTENFWRNVPFNFTFYSLNMKKEVDRKRGKRFLGK
ncbi:hypothetical protein M9H77_03328 [Catharanthus roseus]|uniref:Uncharacterized protein n=1 Tax=Catharanthus roseus TaxID=4058 RepID=A0ACC0CAZ6_CATRO|nr:hypothetical protein M9H77_03328 [Catharanthus roseus]